MSQVQELTQTLLEVGNTWEEVSQSCPDTDQH